MISDLIVAAWLVWLAIWVFLSRNVKANLRTESFRSRVLNVGPLVLAVYLLAAPSTSIDALDRRFAPEGEAFAWLGAALTIAGIAFSVWARLMLAGNWSGNVTLKRGHELVTTGPYALARHPIYTGLILALIGTALAIGERRALLALLIVLAALWRKIRLEERLMRATFGAAYEEYAERTAALAPFVL